MKLFEFLHNAAIVSGSLGVLAILGAWWLQWTGQLDIYGLSQGHLYNDAVVLLLAAIWFMTGAFWHKWAGK